MGGAIGSYAFYAFVCLRYMGFIVVTTLTTRRPRQELTAHMPVAAHKQDWEREERNRHPAAELGILAVLIL